jgi:hypothetical protein
MRRFASLPHLVLFALLAVLLGLAERKSPMFEQLLQEDGWAEWATFLAFAAAAFINLKAAGVRARAPHARVACLGLGLFCLFVAGEEISWGQRILGFRPPNYFLEQNYQQEANLHNLLKDVLDTRFMVLAIALLVGVLTPFLARVTRWPSALSAEFSLLPWFAVVAWLEFSYSYELVGELAELLLGLLLLVDACARTEQEPARAALLGFSHQAAALALAVLIVPLNDALLRWNSADNARAAREDLDTLKERISRGELVQPKLLRKKRVHKRMYTAVRAGYLALDGKRHYLDPWNNPYWIAYQAAPGNAGGTAVLYSFGPNRRRDLVLSENDDTELFGLESASPEGDDIRVVIHLSSQSTRRADSSRPAHAER